MSLRSDHIVIEGGRQLHGAVRVNGAKNAVLKHMVAMLMAPGVHRLANVPGILDVDLMCQVLAHAGATCDRTDHELVVTVPDEIRPEAPLELVRQMRASIVVMGPMLARCGEAKVAFPGGDDLGARPIDMHLDGLRQMGAEFSLEHGVLTGTATSGLHGAEIELDFPSVGATENVMLAAALAKGQTVINNAAREPEIEDVAGFLNAMGASVSGAGSSVVIVEGVGELHPAHYAVVPDRLEAGTYAMAAAITGGSVRIDACRPEHLRMELRKLEAVGCEITRGDDWFAVTAEGRPRAVDVATLPFPGFHTDLQPQMVAVLAIADGTSIVTENLYDARFRYVGELLRMGADISIEIQNAVIRGVERLSGCPVVAPDIRAGAALALAGLGAEGRTVLAEVHHVDRGYEDFVGSLAQLGADITRTSS